MKVLSILLSLTTLLLSLSEHIVEASEGTCLEVRKKHVEVLMEADLNNLCISICDFIHSIVCIFSISRFKPPV